MSAIVIQHDARALPLPDASVDLVVTSPPYFALRSYQDGGEHASRNSAGVGLAADLPVVVIAVTAECIRVLKPSGSIFVNLGDKYSSGSSGDRNTGFNERSGNASGARVQERSQVRSAPVAGMQPKSLLGMPWRYALRCIDDLGLILRAEIIWSKPNGLPESVTDRVRRSHEQWFHFTKQPRYFSAVDEVREEFSSGTAWIGRAQQQRVNGDRNDGGKACTTANPLGKLPGSVWEVPTQPLTVPAHLGVDHFAAFPVEWPKRLIQGWCPRSVCTVCKEGRRPTTTTTKTTLTGWNDRLTGTGQPDGRIGFRKANAHSITGYACACPDTSAPATPGIVLDPFGGTGTTALAAHALGRVGISNDLSGDYCRLAKWRTSDRGEIAKVLGVTKPPVQISGQVDLFGEAAS